MILWSWPFFTLLDFLGPTIQLPNKSHRESYFYLWMPTLDWLVSSQLFLTWIIPSTSCLWAFIFLFFRMLLLSFYFHVCFVSGGLNIEVILLILPLNVSSFSSSLFPILFSALLLAIHLFLKPIRCFRQEA